MKEEPVCALCGQDTREVSESCDCTGIGLLHPSEELNPVPFLGAGCCEGCNVAHGGNHHFGCEFELCPRCGEPLVECGHDVSDGLEVDDEDDEDEEDDWDDDEEDEEEDWDDEEDDWDDEEDDWDDEDDEDDDCDDEGPEEPSPRIDPEPSVSLEEPVCC